MHSFFKHVYGELLSIYRNIFAYSKQTLSLDQSFDYDAYWLRKRGDRIGVLSSWQKARADIILAQIRKEGGRTIGDIGCGEGSILAYLIQNASNIEEGIGYDTSPVALEKAAQLGIKGILLDIGEKGWEEKVHTADYLMLLETIEHVPNSEEVVAKALSKARKGIFISVPNSGYFTYRLRLLFGKFPSQWLNFPNEHVRFWTLADMRWWLKALGYPKGRAYTYKGIPLINSLFPSVFAAGIVVYIPSAT